MLSWKYFKFPKPNSFAIYCRSCILNRTLWHPNFRSNNHLIWENTYQILKCVASEFWAGLCAAICCVIWYPFTSKSYIITAQFIQQFFRTLYSQTGCSWSWWKSAVFWKRWYCIGNIPKNNILGLQFRVGIWGSVVNERVGGFDCFNNCTRL